MNAGARTTSEPLPRADDVRSARSGETWLLIGGLAAFGAALIWWAYSAGTQPGWGLAPVDMGVFRDAGLIVRHVRPLYHPHLASPLYGRLLYHGEPFDYPPFAALPFALMSYLPLPALAELAALADVIALLVAIWVTFGGLGYQRGAFRLGLTLLAAAAVFFTEPVQRTMYLGQVEIVLMAVVMWDMCQPDSRRWKGAGVGIAAGIKLLPLLFIPYLLLTRRYRQAAVAAGAFAATLIVGFIALPRDSWQWLVHGLFLKANAHIDLHWSGNQSLMGIILRSGSQHANAEWLVVAAIVIIVGTAGAVLLDRAGHRVIALLMIALITLLVSPLSWDDHWVWIAASVPVLIHYALRASGAARWAWLGLAAAVTAVFAGWPDSWLGRPNELTGIIFLPPQLYRPQGGPWPENAWHGWQLIVGNAWVLTGLLAFVTLLLAGLRWAGRASRPAAAVSPAGEAAP
jgi:alpha-1,2-mannosyltransferase